MGSEICQKRCFRPLCAFGYSERGRSERACARGEHAVVDGGVAVVSRGISSGSPLSDGRSDRFDAAQRELPFSGP
jgi:hypothetical protein